MSFSNSIRAGLLAFGLALPLGGCGTESGIGPEGITPLGGEDGGLPNTARNRFDSCFPPDQGLAILLDGRGAVYGDPPSTPVDGGSAVTIDRESLSFTGESNSFRANGRWASAPLEFYAQNPGDPGYGMMAQRTSVRANGDPLTSLRRSGMAGSWADQFPEFAAASGLGFVWAIDGDFDPEGCHLNIRIRGAVRTASGGMSDPMSEVAVPLYLPRPDGGTRVATSTFDNEALAIMSEPIVASLIYPTAVDASGALIGPPTTVCSGGSCGTVRGTTLQRLDVRMAVSPPSDPDAGSVDADVDAGSTLDAGTSDPDGGIPPLADPDAGSGG